MQVVTWMISFDSWSRHPNNFNTSTFWTWKLMKLHECKKTEGQISSASLRTLAPLGTESTSAQTASTWRRWEEIKSPKIELKQRQDFVLFQVTFCYLHPHFHLEFSRPTRSLYVHDLSSCISSILHVHSYIHDLRLHPTGAEKIGPGRVGSVKVSTRKCKVLDVLEPCGGCRNKIKQTETEKTHDW